MFRKLYSPPPPTRGWRAGERQEGRPGFSSRETPALTAIFFGCDSARFGTFTVRTPSAMSASTPSAETLLGSAKERVKVSFLLQKIAEKEEIKVAQDEIARRIGSLAAIYQIPPEQFVKDLQKRNGLIEIYDQLMNEKVLDFLQQNARIEEVPAGSLSRPQAS